MSNKIPPSRWEHQDAQATARAEKKRKSASDDAISELQELVKVRLRSERRPRSRSTLAESSSIKGVAFASSEAAKKAREAILGPDRGSENDGPREDSGGTLSSVRLQDRDPPAGRVFSRLRSLGAVCFHLLACILTVLAGCELAHAFDLMFFAEGRNGAILAAVLGCFAAARWITKD